MGRGRTRGSERGEGSALSGKGTPEPIIRKLHDATVQAMDTPAVKQRLEGLGASLVAPERRSPEYLAGFVKSEIEKWAAPIKASGVSME